ncbi:histidine--tRNA ligase [Listeria ivanovii]|uniref:Histidine--tRNA ligase n=1 Tax=Listeria ivanovii subsp. londoniensis TaxID=202752 RepID=A0ABS1G6P8_LISIV|nr:histidine--tRNA ligase [Listeria ivanovii]AIS59924.1 histidyl-tRNA synthetase [Listeria ivanovii subsp. londoniensis]AIS62749.1 histidyl-tRNA synthetase [Listeria ivanovii subsp. londoniensis]MBK1962543.1 histidine--tRNA ligase [Listeria ivanovii subsp. londoniensis]MBK1967334.1 histidine--tRNA ligase [Listeria ivanovii subsp. londoniensis]MBK1985272.1 histidine--tRNA ligase [Listeria ivanovii subsp. londoniensis]
MQLPRGTRDILPNEVTKWHFLETAFASVCENFQYEEIRTPIFEHTELFERGVGDSTDIVSKEMYTFQDKGGRSLTLRPEGTASVVRAFVEHKLYGEVSQPIKLYYNEPMFRYERPQGGRQRQFTQMGIEAIGSDDPSIDVEVISLAMAFFTRIGLRNIKLVINSLGDKESRLRHREALVSHFEPHIDEFCAECQVRLHKNPLRILDCKKDHDNPLIQSAPSILAYLNEKSIAYFDNVQTYLNALEIPFEIDPTMVRGLDYYNHTTFEIMSEEEGFGAKTTLCGGGRYHGLVKEFGGPDTPGIGFGIGVERILLALEKAKVLIPVKKPLEVYVIAAQPEAELKAVTLVNKLRENRISAEKDYLKRKLKAQLKDANRKNAVYTIILGEEELETGKYQLKNMETGEQESIFEDSLIMVLKEKLIESKEEK